jgi:epsilon-lactone hydrolase
VARRPLVRRRWPAGVTLPLALLASLAVASCGGERAVEPRPVAGLAEACPSASASAVATVTCPDGAHWDGKVCTAPVLATATDFDSLAPTVAAANAKPGVRHVPARDLPVPAADVSPQEQAFIARGLNPHLGHHLKDAAEWKALIAKVGASGEKDVRDMAAKLHVTIKPTTVAGVPCFELSPEVVPARNRNRLLVHVHGGAYVFGAGIGGADEGVMLAGLGGFKVLAIDYRMPPDFPYPAAIDDAMAVWKKAVTMANPKNMAIFGSSTGGGLTLAMALRARDEHLPLPAAMAPGTPWADLTDTGDSYETNEWIDNVLVSAHGILADAALLYAGGHDLKDPMLSPIYGDFRGLPPAILTTGTRDLFLSNTVRTHRKLRRAGVEADLNVYEGQSHAQYMFDPDVPETKEAMADIAAFFDRHLGVK